MLAAPSSEEALSNTAFTKERPSGVSLLLVAVLLALDLDFLCHGAKGTWRYKRLLNVCKPHMVARPSTRLAVQDPG